MLLVASASEQDFSSVHELDSNIKACGGLKGSPIESMGVRTYSDCTVSSIVRRIQSFMLQSKKRRTSCRKVQEIGVLRARPRLLLKIA